MCVCANVKLSSHVHRIQPVSYCFGVSASVVILLRPQIYVGRNTVYKGRNSSLPLQLAYLPLNAKHYFQGVYCATVSLCVCALVFLYVHMCIISCFCALQNSISMFISLFVCVCCYECSCTSLR